MKVIEIGGMKIFQLSGKAVIQSNPADPQRKDRVLFYRNMILSL